MTGRSGSKSDTARLFYNATAAATGDFALMNYGYAPPGASAVDPADPERYCLELYHHLLANADLRDRRVLEVSCGRGGGAAHVVAGYRPAEYVGVDISEENIVLAERRFAAVTGLTFEVGRAEHLPFAEESFDAVINVEASHLYDDHARFFAEVYRVLRPGGAFFYTDLFWSNSDPEPLLARAGFLVTHSEDITANVLRSLDLDSERRERVVASSIPPHLRDDYRNWSGIKGYRAYNRFASGEWVYRCFRLQRPQ
jgi:SAM-dependent methyltransferase